MQRITRAQDSIWRLAENGDLSSRFDLTDPRYWDEVERIEREMNSQTGGTRHFDPNHDYGSQVGDHSDSSYHVNDNAEAADRERERREREDLGRQRVERGVAHLNWHPDWREWSDPLASENTYERTDRFGGRHMTRPGTSSIGTPGWDYSFHAGPGRSEENDGLYTFPDAEDATNYSSVLEHNDDVAEAQRRGWNAVGTAGAPTVHKRISDTSHFIFFPDAANGNHFYIRHPGVDGSSSSLHDTFDEAAREV